MSTDRVPMSARVEPAFRERVLAAGRRAGDPDQSATVRRLLELGLRVDESAVDGTPAP